MKLQIKKRTWLFNSFRLACRNTTPSLRTILTVCIPTSYCEHTAAMLKYHKYIPITAKVTLLFVNQDAPVGIHTLRYRAVTLVFTPVNTTETLSLFKHAQAEIWPLWSCSPSTLWPMASVGNSSLSTGPEFMVWCTAQAPTTNRKW